MTTSTTEWINGPVPDGTDGLLLVVLTDEPFHPSKTPPFDYYYGEPVAVRWWVHKGKTTMGHYTIVEDWVLKWRKLE